MIDNEWYKIGTEQRAAKKSEPCEKLNSSVLF